MEMDNQTSSIGQCRRMILVSTHRLIQSINRMRDERREMNSRGCDACDASHLLSTPLFWYCVIPYSILVAIPLQLLLLLFLISYLGRLTNYLLILQPVSVQTVPLAYAPNGPLPGALPPGKRGKGERRNKSKNHDRYSIVFNPPFQALTCYPKFPIPFPMSVMNS